MDKPLPTCIRTMTDREAPTSIPSAKDVWFWIYSAKENEVIGILDLLEDAKELKDAIEEAKRSIHLYGGITKELLWLAKWSPAPRLY